MSTLFIATCESLWLHNSNMFYQVTCNSYMTIVVSKFIDVTPVLRASMYCDVTSPTYLETYAYLSYIYCTLVYLKAVIVMLPTYIYIYYY